MRQNEEDGAVTVADARRCEYALVERPVGPFDVWSPGPRGRGQDPNGRVRVYAVPSPARPTIKGAEGSDSLAPILRPDKGRDVETALLAALMRERGDVLLRPSAQTSFCDPRECAQPIQSATDGGR